MFSAKECPADALHEPHLQTSINSTKGHPEPEKKKYKKKKKLYHNQLRNVDEIYIKGGHASSPVHIDTTVPFRAIFSSTSLASCHWMFFFLFFLLCLVRSRSSPIPTLSIPLISWGSQVDY